MIEVGDGLEENDLDEAVAPAAADDKQARLEKRNEILLSFI